MSVSGILLLDKPEGLSSNHALQRAKHAFGADKAGHAGTLDPLATGMLPICFGEACKVAGYLLGNRKAYRATLKLGAETDTYDALGEVTATYEVPAVSDQQLADVLATFVGRIEQRPPAYSAIKKNGVPLYKLARKGVEVEAAIRTVEIDRIDLKARTADTLTIDVTCGSGTYIRSLAFDIGRALGSGAHLAALRRLWVEPFENDPMTTLAEVQAGSPETLARKLLPLDRGLSFLPRIDVTAAEADDLRHGRRIERPGCADGEMAAYDADGRLLGLVERAPDGAVKVRRLIHA